MISKACIVGQYQKKLEELAACPEIELTVIVPPFWRDERGVIPLERAHTQGYQLRVERLRFNGQYHLHFYPTLPRVLQELRPDLVHIDEEPYNFATFHAQRAARRIGARTLFFTWQNLWRRYPVPFSWFESSVYRHAACAIAGNADAAHVLRQKNFRGPIHVIPQFGTDPAQFQPAPHPAPRFRLGYIGRLVEEKGVEVLLRAAAELTGDWEIKILGSGPQLNELQALARELNIAARVQFHPPIPSREIPAFYQQLDVLVLASRTRANWKEQFGRVLVEAMASGVPVIGSTCGEIPNVIGDAGIIFPEDDVAALRAAMTELRADNARRAELSARGRARVLAHFTQKHIAAATYAVYREILGVVHSP